MKMIFAVSIILKMSLSLHSLLRNKKAEWRCLWLASLLQSIFIDTVYFHAKNSDVFIFSFIKLKNKSVVFIHIQLERHTYNPCTKYFAYLHFISFGVVIMSGSDKNRIDFCSLLDIFFSHSNKNLRFFSFFFYLLITHFFLLLLRCEMWMKEWCSEKIALFGDGGSVSLLYFLETQKGPK